MTGWAATAWKTLITTSAFPQRPRCYPADLLQSEEGETNTKRSDLFMCFKSLLLQLRASGLIFKPWADFCFCRGSFEGPAGASGGPSGSFDPDRGVTTAGPERGRERGWSLETLWPGERRSQLENNLLMCTDIKSYLVTSRLEVMVLNICTRGRAALHFWFTFTVSGAAWLKLI